MFLFVQAFRSPPAMEGDEEEKRRKKFVAILEGLGIHLPQNPSLLTNKSEADKAVLRFVKPFYAASKEMMSEEELSKAISEWADKKDSSGNSDPGKLYRLGTLLANSTAALMRKKGEPASNSWMGKDKNGKQAIFDERNNAWMVFDDIDRMAVMLFWLGAYDSSLKKSLATTAVPDKYQKYYDLSIAAMGNFKIAADAWLGLEDKDRQRISLAKQANALSTTYQQPGLGNIAQNVVFSNTSSQHDFRYLYRARDKRESYSDENVEPSVLPGQYRLISIIDYMREQNDPQKMYSELDAFCNYAAESFAYQSAFGTNSYAKGTMQQAQQVFDNLFPNKFLNDPQIYTSEVLAQYGSDLSKIWKEFHTRFVLNLNTKGAFDMLNPDEPFGQLVKWIEDRSIATNTTQSFRKVMLQTFDVRLLLWTHENKDFIKALQDYTNNYYSGPQLFFGGAVYGRARGTRAAYDESSSKSVTIGRGLPTIEESSSSYVETKGLFGFEYSHWINFLQPVKSLDNYLSFRYRGKLGFDVGGYTITEKNGRTVTSLSDFPEKLSDIAAKNRITYSGSMGVGIGDKFALNAGGTFGPEKPILFSFLDYKVFDEMKFGDKGVLAMHFRVTDAARNTGMPPELAVMFTYDNKDSYRISAGMAAVPRGVTFTHLFPAKTDITNLSFGISSLDSFAIFNQPFLNFNVGPTERIGDIGFPSLQLRLGFTLIPPPSKYETIRREF